MIMDNHLDIFGQQPFFTMNTQIYFAFPLTETSSDTAIIRTLTEGLERLYDGFPWLACEVINEGSCEGCSGVYKFKAVGTAPRIIVKDHRKDASRPTMEDLRQASFPMRMLDENDIAPRKTFPGSATPEAAPAFLIQANFITGGLILTFLAQHNTMDMIGQAHIIHLFAKACRKEAFTSEELLSGNVSRHSIVPLLGDSYTPGPELDRHIMPGSAQSQNAPVVPTSDPPPENTWAYFTFSSALLAALKTVASEGINPTEFVSTDDALTAFIWQSIIRARFPRLRPTAESTIARAVNARPYLGISPLYPGPIQTSAYSKGNVQALAEGALGNIALQLRSAIDPKTSNFEFETRAIATYLSREPDKAKFSSTAKFDLSVDLILSSWAKVRGYDVDFDLGLGKAEAVRRPRFCAVEGLVFLMPRTPNGDVAVAISLRDEDLKGLRGDAKFGKYAKYIG